MARHREPLDGGLWSAPDPALLKQGQLASMLNCHYLPGTNGLNRARGRGVYTTVSAVAVDVVGGRGIQFDNADAFNVMVAASSAYYAPVGATAATAFLTSMSSTAASLERVHYLNRHYMLNGATASGGVIGTNFVVYNTATATGGAPTVRQHGMLAVSAAPSTGTASAGLFSQTVTGYYEYWTTEVARLTQDDSTFIMESTFDSHGGPTTVFVTSTAMVPMIQMPIIRNSITTHWRIYRSPKKDRESDKKFPIGFMISEVGTATTAQGDTQTTQLTGFKFPANFNNASTATNIYADFSNASRMGAQDGSYATASASGFGFRTLYQGTYGYNFGGFAGNVKGIEVKLTASATVATPISITLGRNRRDPLGDFKEAPYNPNPYYQLNPYTTRPVSKSVTVGTGVSGYSLGGSADRWYPGDSPGFADKDFGTDWMLVLGFNVNTNIGIDAVQVQVYYGGAIDSTVQFPTVIYTFGDISAQVGKNGVPPSSNTGDLFQDSLVLNDLANPSFVRWSYPGDVEAFPSTYFLDFQTPENDKVRGLRVVNGRLMCWLDRSSWRFNYLPSERDAQFDRGKAIEPISRSYGCVSPMCIANFSMDNQTEMVAWVSWDGVHASDGFSFDTYTNGIDWSQILSRTSTSVPVALVNDQSRRELIFYYRNDALGNESYKALHLQYGARHLQEGQPKVGGPVNVRNFDAGTSQRGDLKSAWVVPVSAGDTKLYLGYGGSGTAAGAGKVYIEQGTANPAQDSHMKYTTRRMFLAGEGNEWTANEIYGYGKVTGAQGTDYSVSLVRTNDSAGESTASLSTISVSGMNLWKTQHRVSVEGASVSMAVTAGDDDRIEEFILIDGQNFGLEDSGR